VTIERAPHSLLLKAEQDGDLLRICLKGDLDMRSAPRLERFLERLGDPRGWTIVLDLSEVTFVDSSGLTAMVGLTLRGRQEGFTAIVEHPSAAVRRVLERTGLNNLLLGTEEREG
jgi:anti-sigma B factor antagonist